MASLLSLNLNGRFRSGAEAHRIGQAVLQRLLRGTDIFIGQQAHFQPSLPGNYRMVGSPSAFVAYNCQLYSATELGHVQCPVHSRFSELPASNWTAARVFFEQTCQEVLVISWFTDDSIRSKKRSEVLLKRLLGAATEFSSSSGLPFLIGGSFNVSMDEADAVLKSSGFADVRCYGYWLDSMRRSVRASNLFFCVDADVSLVHVRPRSLSGNLCLGYKNDNWVNPEDSFFWDPLSAKITITKATSTTSMTQMFVASDSLTFSPPESAIKDAPAASKPRGDARRRRQNFDVIRTTKNYETSNSSSSSSTSSTISTLRHFALGLQQSSHETAPQFHEEGDDSPYLPALLAISQTSVKRKQTAERQVCLQSEVYDTEELREVLTRLRVGRDVRIGEDEQGKGENNPNTSGAEDYDFGEYFVDHRACLTTDDLDRMSSGQFSHKLSTISESGESSCSSYRDKYDDDGEVSVDEGSLHIELDDSESTPVSSVEVSNDDDLPKDRRTHWKDNHNNNNNRESLDGGYTADGSAEEKFGGIIISSSSSSSFSAVRRVSSKKQRSSREERIVEGASDVDQDDTRSAFLSLGGGGGGGGRYSRSGAAGEEAEEEEEEEKKRRREDYGGEEKGPRKLRSKKAEDRVVVVRNYENHVGAAFEENCSSISEFYEETSFESSNFACRLM